MTSRTDSVSECMQPLLVLRNVTALDNFCYSPGVTTSDRLCYKPGTNISYCFPNHVDWLARCMATEWRACGKDNEKSYDYREFDDSFVVAETWYEGGHVS